MCSSILNFDAVFVLLKLYEKFKGFNRYDLSLTYKEINSKMSNTLFSRSIWELLGFGFIDVRRFGGLERNCTIFCLSQRWRKLNDKPEKLDLIQGLLSEMEKLKRQPGSAKKRMKINELRKKVLNFGTNK